jgi:hypothetical protein
MLRAIDGAFTRGRRAAMDILANRPLAEAVLRGVGKRPRRGRPQGGIDQVSGHLTAVG